MFVALGSRHPRHGPAVGSRGLRNRPQKGTVRASVAAPALVWAPSIIALLILVIRAARNSVRSRYESKPLIFETSCPIYSHNEPTVIWFRLSTFSYTYNRCEPSHVHV